MVKNLRKIKPTQDTAVYDYYLKKIAEGKKDKQAIVAGMNKFFRIYYARAMETYRECEESQKCNTEERNERRSRK